MNNKETKNDGIKGLLRSLREIKGAWIFILLFALGILLIVFSGSNTESTPPEKVDIFDEAAYTAQLETRLTSLLAAIDGIGYVQVMVTLDSTHKNVYAEDTTNRVTETSSEVQSTLSFYNDKSTGTYPILLTETLPAVRGVAVVCKNGANPDIQLKVTNLLTSLLGVSSNRIYVTR